MERCCRTLNARVLQEVPSSFFQPCLIPFCLFCFHYLLLLFSAETCGAIPPPRSLQGGDRNGVRRLQWEGLEGAFKVSIYRTHPYNCSMCFYCKCIQWDFNGDVFFIIFVCVCSSCFHTNVKFRQFDMSTIFFHTHDIDYVLTQTMIASRLIHTSIAFHRISPSLYHPPPFSKLLIIVLHSCPIFTPFSGI